MMPISTVNLVLCDTGAWIALAVSNDQQHHSASACYRDLASRRARLLTTNYIVSETATWLRYHAGVETALGFRRMISSAIEQDRLRLQWIESRIEQEAWEIMERYSGVAISLTDATTAAVARRRRTTTIFGFDRDFEALGLSLVPSG